MINVKKSKKLGLAISILLSLISLGCQTKIEKVPVIVPIDCPILKSIPMDEAVVMHEVSKEGVENLYSNIRVLIAATGCDYSSPDMWE